MEGQCKRQTLTVLTDSCSTHNFLDPTMAKQVGCPVLPTQKLLVSVAVGSSITTSAIIPEFQWKMQGEQFTTEVRLLPLGGCDMVLGVQWLKEASPISMDLKEMSFSIQQKGTTLKLLARNSTGSQLKLISGAAMQKYRNKKYGSP